MRSNHWLWGGIALTAIAIGATADRPAEATSTPLTFELVGLTVPSHLAAVAPEQSGTIIEMPALEGSRVEPGTVLYRLSDELPRLEVLRLQALVESRIEQDRAAASLSYAQKKVERVRHLSDRDVAAAAELQEVQLESELARLAVGRVDFEAAQLRNELAQAQARLDQRTLKSPLAGVVTRRFKQVGETADQLEPIVEVMALHPLWVEFQCPVSLESEVRTGGAVLVRPATGNHEPRRAEIVHISLRATPTSQSFLVRAALDNEDYSWRAGLKMVVTPGLGSAATTPPK